MLIACFSRLKFKKKSRTMCVSWSNWINISGNHVRGTYCQYIDMKLRVTYAQMFIHRCSSYTAMRVQSIVLNALENYTNWWNVFTITRTKSYSDDSCIHRWLLWTDDMVNNCRKSSFTHSQGVGSLGYRFVKIVPRVVYIDSSEFSYL